MEKLNLIKKQAYAVWIELDERGPSVISSIYQESHLAEKGKKGISWYGGDGRVQQQEVWQDTETNQIYVLEKFGNGYFADDVKGQRHAKLDEIKRKLSPEELKFLFDNMTYEELAKLNNSETKISINTENFSGQSHWRSWRDS